ncbi:MAG: hypothetical protein H0U77_08115 [Nocardioidaceae bacterium]|nr:hypothetical protein [Nocardioidaceae bacterium]
MTVLTLVSLFIGALAALGVLAEPRTQRDPIGWLLLGCGGAGAGAVLFLDHPGLSQWYFLWTAEVPVSILAAWGLVLVLERSSRPVMLAATGAVVGVIAVSVTLGLFVPLATTESSSLRAWSAFSVFAALTVGLAMVAARVVPTASPRAVTTALSIMLVAVTVAGIVPAVQNATADSPDLRTATATTPGAFHDGQVEAARWIRDHSGADDVVLTDRHCRGAEVPTCDRRRFFVTAYSERRVLVEGWAYTDRGNESSPGMEDSSPRSVAFWDQDLLALNDGFLDDPDRTAARELYALGVRWIFVDRTVGPLPSFAGVAERSFTTPTAAVYRLLPDD